MSNLPRWFHRIDAYNNHYEEYQKRFQQYEYGLLKEYSEYKLVFYSMKNCYVYYCRVLKDILKTCNIKESLPLKILIIAQEKNLINDADIWIDFIADVNELCQTASAELIKELTLNIIEKYKNKVENQHNILINFKQKSTLQDNEIIKDLDKKTKPKYKASDLGITKNSYNKILNYLKKTDCIKYIWLHGSRSKGNARFSADIDLVGDFPQDRLSEIRQNLYNLNIPYRIDMECIHSDDEFRTVDFIRTATQNTKLIYRAEDFR